MPHLAGPIHPVVVRMHPPNLGQQLRVADHPVTRWAVLGRVVGARGDRAAMLRQHPADRLDPELPTIDHIVAMLINETHERGDGRSSSAAKKADAVFKIAFARRNSRFSRSNSTNRRRSSVAKPRLGAGVDLGLLHPAAQRVPVDAQLLPTRRQAPVTDSCSCSSAKRSSTRRTARSRTSGGYFFGADMTPPFRGINASTKAGTVHTHGGSTKINNPTSTPASNASTPNASWTGATDDEHPQRHEGLRSTGTEPAIEFIGELPSVRQRSAIDRSDRHCATEAAGPEGAARL